MKLKELNTFIICFEAAKDAIMRDDASWALDRQLADLRVALDAVSKATAMPALSAVPLSFCIGCCEQVRAWLDAGEHMRVGLLDCVAGSMQTLARWSDGRLQDEVERRKLTSRMAGR